MKIQNALSQWIKRFLLEYLIVERNLSCNTQQSYCDTFRLFIPFVAKQMKKPIGKLTIEDISTRIVQKFLSDVETIRNCSLATRNQRLSSIHSFANFISLHSPEYMDWSRQITLIPFKKTKQPLINYLEKPEMDALLDAPDCSTQQGKRDYAILLFLYNSGARADEAAQLTIADLELSNNPNKYFSSVLIRGKGNKLRRCPLWAKTVIELTLLTSEREKTEHVFLNRYCQPITRFGIYALVKRYIKKIVSQVPSLKEKCVSPHTIRHTTATHLLRAGVDINTIRSWLGHVSVNTTNVYAEVDLEMKAKALSVCEIKKRKSKKHWRDDDELMHFLATL